MRTHFNRLNIACTNPAWMRLLNFIVALFLFAVPTTKTMAEPATAGSAQTRLLSAPSIEEQPLTSYEMNCRELIKKKFNSASEKLNAIFDFKWNYDMENYPEAATYAGDSRGQDRFTDMTLEAIRLRKRQIQCVDQLIRTIDRTALSSREEQLSYDIFLFDISSELEGQKFPRELLVLDQMGGVHTGLSQIFSASSKRTSKDFENLLSRLEKTPQLLEQHRLLLEEGVRRGITPPRKTLMSVPKQLDRLTKIPPTEHPYLKPFERMPTTIPPEQQKELRTRAQDLLTKGIFPSLRRLQNYLEKEYIPRARSEIAFTSLPDGEAWYKYLAKTYTTTNLAPLEIHQIGLNESKRLVAEIEKLMKQTGWKKNRSEFYHFLRTDPRFFFKTEEDLLREYRNIAKNTDPLLIELFGRLPRIPYGIQAIPSFSAKEGPTGYYEGGSLEAGRSGWFFANTYDLKSRPKWEMETLTLHETVPGHHLQISLAKEMTNLPRFRREVGFTAFIEGWGLYAESLGNDMGLFKDPYAKIGHIAYDLWRANRLVVDTGMHALGWGRQQAIDFMKAHLPKAIHDIEVEVDRYIVMPGQALAYKIGQLKIMELRKRAEKELGDRFDIRKFHDVLLESGSLPLPVLEKKIETWIAEYKNKKD